jgi:hypothetical protein
LWFQAKQIPEALVILAAPHNRILFEETFRMVLYHFQFPTLLAQTKARLGAFGGASHMSGKPRWHPLSRLKLPTENSTDRS